MRAEAAVALLLFAPLAAAQVAPAAAPPAAAPAVPAAPAAPDLGTLFHSAEERARLDRMRRGEVPEPEQAQRGPPAVTGFVQRSDGRNTVWIDGRPMAVTGARAGPLFDPRAVRDLPPRPEPPPKAEAKTEAKAGASPGAKGDAKVPAEAPPETVKR